MLLAVDCGNTHLVIGLFDGEKLLRSWRLSTDTRKTEDEYLVMLAAVAGGGWTFSAGDQRHGGWLRGAGG